jgi:hypothetical protein
MSSLTDDSFPPHYFARIDEAVDSEFYAFARKLVHVDDEAIAAIGRLYERVLPPGGRLLDLMSSWRSHLPAALRPDRVIGLGLNAEEMEDNPQLDEHVVHDLNRDESLPFSDNEFDGVMCAVSVQYMVHPVRTFREVNRVLRPEGVFVLTFSNRCFPEKAVALWRTANDRQHIEIVRRYFEAAGGWIDITAADWSARPVAFGGDPLFAVWASKPAPD